MSVQSLGREHGLPSARSPLHKIRSRAPLRLGLAGGGTDVSPYSDQYGGAILNATIDRYAFAFIEPSPDWKIRFVATDFGVDETFPLDMDALAHAKLKLHAAVYRRMVDQFGGGPPDRAPRSGPPSTRRPGSGLGSSSALVVGAGRGVPRGSRLAPGRLRCRASRVRDRADRPGALGRQAGPLCGGVRRRELHRVLGRLTASSSIRWASRGASERTRDIVGHLLFGSFAQLRSDHRRTKARHVRQGRQDDREFRHKLKVDARRDEDGAAAGEHPGDGAHPQPVLDRGKRKRPPASRQRKI